MPIKNIIARTDKRILILLVIVFLGVGYSVYRAVDALSGGETSPEYRRSPPGAFAVPLTDSIVDVRMLQQDRVPDQIYINVKKQTDFISERVLENTLTVSDLTRISYNPSDAEIFVLEVRNRQAAWSSYQNREIDPSVGLAVAVPTIIVTRTLILDRSLGAGENLKFGYRLNEDGTASLISIGF